MSLLFLNYILLLLFSHISMICVGAHMYHRLYVKIKKQTSRLESILLSLYAFQKLNSGHVDSIQVILSHLPGQIAILV